MSENVSSLSLTNVPESTAEYCTTIFLGKCARARVCVCVCIYMPHDPFEVRFGVMSNFDR